MHFNLLVNSLLAMIQSLKHLVEPFADMLKAHATKGLKFLIHTAFATFRILQKRMAGLSPELAPTPDLILKQEKEEMVKTVFTLCHCASV